MSVYLIHSRVRNISAHICLSNLLYDHCSLESGICEVPGHNIILTSCFDGAMRVFDRRRLTHPLATHALSAERLTRIRSCCGGIPSCVVWDVCAVSVPSPTCWRHTHVCLYVLCVCVCLCVLTLLVSCFRLIASRQCNSGNCFRGQLCR
jgi:hypothetical protein